MAVWLDSDFRHEVFRVQAECASSWGVCLEQRVAAGVEVVESCTCSSHTSSLWGVDCICLLGLQQAQLPAFSFQGPSVPLPGLYLKAWFRTGT